MTDPNASGTPAAAPSAPAAESAPSAGSSTPSAASSSSPATVAPSAKPRVKLPTSSGLKAKMSQALAEIADTTQNGMAKLPLNEQWYARYNGDCWELVEMTDPGEINPFTKEPVTNTAKRHHVRGYYGALSHLLIRYIDNVVADSQVGTAKSVLAKIQEVEATIRALCDKVGVR